MNATFPVETYKSRFFLPAIIRKILIMADAALTAWEDQDRQ